jgi:predicted lipoprotein
MTYKNNLNYLAGIVCALLFAATLVVSCDSSDEGPGGTPAPDFDQLEMLENYADNLIIPAYTDLQSHADLMKTAVSDFEADPNVANLEVLQANLKSLRTSWQHANFYQFGPAETNTLRAVMNTYPTDTDKINQNIESGSYTLGSLDNIAAGGLPALDYLIHGMGDTPEQIVEAFTSDPMATARMAYLVDNVSFVENSISNVTSAWDPAGGDYRGIFLSPLNSGTGIGSSLGLMANAMIQHYERFMRDGKIGIPAGVRSAGVPRPTATEAFYGGYSAELAEINIEALRNLYNGANGSGFDDYLIFAGANVLDNDIDTELEEAISDASKLTDPLSQNIENDNERVIQVFTSLQEALVLLKVDMTSILGITITFKDNDGD